MATDRYGCVIPTPDMSPAAVERRRVRRAASVKAADAWGARWWKRQRAYIEEHDPFSPFDAPYPDTPSSDPDLRRTGVTFEEETGQ